MLTTVVRTKTFRAYLSRRGYRNLVDFLGQLTWLWNVALSERKQAWKKEQRSVSFYDQCKTLTTTRQGDRDVWERFSVLAQRSTLNRLHHSYQDFFRRGGFPRYKSEHRGVRSFEVRCPKIRSNGQWSWVKVKGIGRIRFRGFPEGTVKLLRVVRTPRRVNVQFVIVSETQTVTDTRPAVGIDLGIKSRVALSTGETFPGAKIDRRETKRRQRRLGKAVRGSANRKKRKAEFSRQSQRVREREKGALHELTTAIVRDHSANLVLENLQIRNMVRNRHLARAIHEQQWGNLVPMLGYKAESAGGQLTKVTPAYTSQTCSSCGWRPDEKIGLSVRAFTCGSCGVSLDRDVNAARNILQKGLAALNPGGASPGTRGDKQNGLVAASA